MRLKKYWRFFPVTSLIIVLLFSISKTRGQESEKNEAADAIGVEVSASQPTVAAGQELKLIIKLKLNEGTHANSNAPKDENLIPTAFIPDKNEFITWSDAQYPKPSEVVEWYSTESLSVFENGAEIVVPLKIESTALIGKIKIGGKLRIQACDHDKCYPAKRIPAYVEITVTDKNK